MQPLPGRAVRRLRIFLLGVQQFAIYLQHDAQDETLRAYGQHVVPAVAERVRAKA